MIRSMTGYGRAQKAVGSRDITVEIKSVNHRYFEMNARIPRAYLSFEEPIRAELRRMIVRGKVDLNLSLSRGEGDEVSAHQSEQISIVLKGGLCNVEARGEHPELVKRLERLDNNVVHRNEHECSQHYEDKGNSCVSASGSCKYDFVFSCS